jgi:hypothetical protein
MTFFWQLFYGSSFHWLAHSFQLKTSISAIHGAAGPELVQACRKVPEVKPGVRCPTGEARITPLVHSLIHFDYENSQNALHTIFISLPDIKCEQSFQTSCVPSYTHCWAHIWCGQEAWGVIEERLWVSSFWILNEQLCCLLSQVRFFLNFMS